MKIIIATDGSECSLAALESAVNRPWPEGTEFLVLSVVEPDMPDYADWHVSYVPSLDAAGLEQIKETEELVANRVEFLKREFPHNLVTGKVVEGNVRDVIVREASEWKSDFIIMGSHGRKGVQKFLLGSVAEAVASRAPCSVEIIRGNVHDAGMADAATIAAASN